MGWLTTLGQTVWYGLVHGAIYVVFALGLTLVFGVMRVMNFAHGELCMIGAMLSYSLMTYLGFPFFGAMFFSIALAAGFGIILNRIVIQPVIRVSPISVLAATFGVSLVLVHGGNILWGPDPRLIASPFPQVLRLGGVFVSGDSIMLFVLGGIAVAALHLFLTRTNMGKAMRAVSQEPTGALLIGINTRAIYRYTLMIAAALAALAGILLSPVSAAYPAMGGPLLIMGFVVVILGGMGNVTGCVIVAFAIGIAEALFGQYVAMYYRFAFIYGLMIIILIFKPEGLFARR